MSRQAWAGTCWSAGTLSLYQASKSITAVAGLRLSYSSVLISLQISVIFFVLTLTSFQRSLILSTKFLLNVYYEAGNSLGG